MLYVLVQTACKVNHSQVFTCNELSKESLLELSLSLAAVLFDLQEWHVCVSIAAALGNWSGVNRGPGLGEGPGEGPGYVEYVES